MSALYQTDIITSATPLETDYAGIHPRIYTSPARLQIIRDRLSLPAYTAFLNRIRTQADNAAKQVGAGFIGDPRGLGCGLANIAGMYALTRDPHYLHNAKETLQALCNESNWGHSLIYGHWAHGVSIAYDWLYDELEPGLRDKVARTLLDRANKVMDAWFSYGDFSPTAYACNHAAVISCGLMSSGCAIWGHIAGAGRVIRFTLEKLRLMAQALGPDGASAEGLAYGQYYIDFFLKSLIQAHELGGVDLLSTTPFVRNYPDFLIYSSLGSNAWSRTSTFMQFGDNNGSHWYGPDVHLRLTAARFKNPHAQYLATQTAQAQINADSSAFLLPFWHDPSLVPKPLDPLPTAHHFQDKDIAILRSGWGASATVFGFKSGPNSGHHAAQNYRHNIAGGHMHPDAGHILLHAHGDWLLVDDGYPKKMTAYQNSILVDNTGQTGESGDWFEDLQIRMGKPEARILTFRANPSHDIVIGDLAPAYDNKHKLTRLLRHILYLKPDVWVIVDEAQAANPTTFQLRFHAPAPFVQLPAGAWRITRPTGSLTLDALSPTPITVHGFVDQIKGLNTVHSDHNLDALGIANQAPQASTLFVTMLQTHPSSQQAATFKPTLTQNTPGSYKLELAGNSITLSITLNPGQRNPATPIFVLD
jgi:hypothetical protein